MYKRKKKKQYKKKRRKQKEKKKKQTLSGFEFVSIKIFSFPFIVNRKILYGIKRVDDINVFFIFFYKRETYLFRIHV